MQKIFLEKVKGPPYGSDIKIVLFLKLIDAFKKLFELYTIHLINNFIFE